MLLLKNNKLVYVDTSEDFNLTIIAVKSLGTSNKDAEYTLGRPRFPDGEKIYLFKMTKSPHSDGSGIGDGFNGAYQTKGEAISRMLEYGFRVYQDGVEILPYQ